MKFLDKLERRFGKFAINGLMRYVIACYIIGYVLYYIQAYTNVATISYLTLEPVMIFRYAQVWRLVSWVLIPPTHSNIIFVVIMLVLYYQLGTTLERTWGAFRFNLYIFGGVIFSILGAVILYFVQLYGFHYISYYGTYFSTYYINMSIFLAFAVAFPDMRIMLYFFIPIKMKWMGLVYAVLMAYDFVRVVRAGSLPGAVAIIASLANFLIYFLVTRNFSRFSPKNVKRRRNFKRASQSSPYNSPPKRGTQRSTGFGGAGSSSGGSRSGGYGNGAPQIHVSGGSGQAAFHKCAICGRTELDDPNLTFRFCSKCNGNYEYCQDHLFTHTHVQ